MWYLGIDDLASERNNFETALENLLVNATTKVL
jgi:hypothetical protein